MREGVASLARDLARLGAPLSLLRGDPADVVPAFAARLGARRVSVSRDYTPFGRARDERVAARLRSDGIGWEASPGLLVTEPEDVLSAAGTPFRVFGPFQRSWLTVPTRSIVARPDRLMGIEPEDDDAHDAHLAADERLSRLLPDVIPTAEPSLLPRPGEEAARA